MIALKCVVYILIGIGAVSVHAVQDPVLKKLAPGPRYQYVQDSEGHLHLVDLWVKLSDIAAAARFQPDVTNEYHLFTRANPTVSQPIVFNHSSILQQSHFDPQRRTVVLIHGWVASATAPSNVVMVPAFLAAGDFNIIVVDWGVGAYTEYVIAVQNAITSGPSVARFLNWLITTSGASPSQFHFAGYSLGGQQAGIIGRNINGDIGYITCLDPASDYWAEEHKFRPTDASYTEVIHTNVGGVGYLEPLGDVDIYPNGGAMMPGCDNNSCSHDRAYYYFAESLTGGIFIARRCATLEEALAGNCTLTDTLQMGGIEPKTGSTGIYYLETNAAPPFAKG